MPRTARIVIKGAAHHITQRGNYKQRIFENDEDRKKYLNILRMYSEKYELKIYAYCLMSNHVHFIVVPFKEDSLGMTYKYTNMKYTNYFNNKKKINGKLWQGRFYSCVLDKNHLISAVRYVENNPVRAEIVKFPWDYEWSSAKQHTGILQSTDNEFLNLHNLSDLDLNCNPEGWKEYLRSKEDHDFIENLRKSTISGKSNL